LACGIGTDCPGERPEPLYGCMVPLQPIRDSFVQQGGTYIYLDNEAGLNSTSTYAGHIMEAMNPPEESIKGVFLVGHSRGATAAVWAASMGNTSRIKALAILDSYLLDDKDNLCKQGYHGCMADGKKVVAGIPTFMGKSSSKDPDIRFPGEAVEFKESDHYKLATNEKAADMIIDFFLAHR